MAKRDVLSEGTRIDGFVIKSLIGAGGFGVTYLAERLGTGEHYAIKEYYPADLAQRTVTNALTPLSDSLTPDYGWGLKRFLEEALTLHQFHHPNIVRLHKRLQLNNTAYMVLNYERGRSLRVWRKDLGRRPSQEEMDALLVPLLSALELVHANLVLHRDVSPDNILLRESGEPVLIDFGSARTAAGARGSLSSIVKHGFSPHEQYGTNAAIQGPWSDIYALAATFWYLLAGSAPPQSMTRVEKDTFTGTAGLNLREYRPGFLAGIDAALKVQPRDRPQSIPEWRRLLFDGRSPMLHAASPLANPARRHAPASPQGGPAAAAHHQPSPVGAAAAFPQPHAAPAGQPSAHGGPMSPPPIVPQNAVPQHAASHQASVAHASAASATMHSDPPSVPSGWTNNASMHPLSRAASHVSQPSVNAPPGRRRKRRKGKSVVRIALGLFLLLVVIGAIAAIAVVIVSPIA